MQTQQCWRRPELACIHRTESSKAGKEEAAAGAGKAEEGMAEEGMAEEGMAEEGTAWAGMVEEGSMA